VHQVLTQAHCRQATTSTSYNKFLHSVKRPVLDHQLEGNGITLQAEERSEEAEAHLNHAD
jgi:hypothetical protein